MAGSLSKGGSLLPAWWVAALVLVADVASKAWIRRHFDVGESVPVVPGIFHLTHVRNAGAAFGLLPGGRLLFLVVTIGVLLAAGYTLWRGTGGRWFRLALGLVMGGAAGNLMDRLRWGTVVDFLDFRVWPVFNLADAAIVSGSAILALTLLREAG
ncbi:MAG: signal peptidase II [Clostridia bacterium]|nr:signal peptidase II [Clostridia bacterium]